MAFSIFLCFFLRMRLRRFLMREPMRVATLASLEGCLKPRRFARAHHPILWHTADVVPVILALDHVQVAIPAGGEDLARSFYVDLLEFTEVDKPAALAGRGGLWLSAGPVRLHLGVDDTFRPATKAHPAFVVGGFDALLDRLAATGVSARPAEEIPGLRRVHVSDPFGNRIELICP